MLHSLIVHVEKLQRLLAEGESTFDVLFVPLLECLLVVALGDLPGQSTAEVGVKGVHACEHFLKKAILVLTGLTGQHQA